MRIGGEASRDSQTGMMAKAEEQSSEASTALSLSSIHLTEKYRSADTSRVSLSTPPSCSSGGCRACAPPLPPSLVSPPLDAI